MNELSEARGSLLRYHKGKEVEYMKYLKIFTDFLEIAQGLSDSTLARLFRAMLAYALNDTEPAFKGNERALWLMVRQSIDREKEAYEAKVDNMERCREVRKQKEIKQKSIQQAKISTEDKDKEKEKDKEKDKDKDIFSSGAVRLTAEKKEIPPTLEEVMTFSQETGLDADAHLFFDYYEANGWYIGKRPMKDWRAAFRAWARNAPTAHQEPTVGDNFRKAMEMLRRKEAKEI